MKSKYIIVTPVKNEIKYFPLTVESMLKQTIKPIKWIIVNDGSSDGTEKLIAELEQNYDWIEAIYLNAQAKRKPGGESVTSHGINKVDFDTIDFYVRMDGDLQFDEDYFSNIFIEFEKNAKLGIASGVCYVDENGKWREEKTPRFHTRAIKTYRVECYKRIGGVETYLGFDTIDEVKANMYGWETKNFPHLKIHHLKKTQSSQGSKANLNVGIAAYNSAYHPLYVLALAFHRLFKKPFIKGSLILVWGFLSGYIKKIPRNISDDFKVYIRKQQINRLLGRETIWK